MVNLEQKRAINAFEACSAEKFGGKAGGEVVKKLPPLIRGNGMLEHWLLRLVKTIKIKVGKEHLMQSGFTSNHSAKLRQITLFYCRMS